jgi:iron complex transport system substrate-binding protein
MTARDDLEEITRAVIDCGFQLHRELGSGLLESAYEILMAAAIADAGFRVVRQVPIGMTFRDIRVEDAFRIDLLVEDCLVIELKSVERLEPVHGKQLLTYLRLMNLPLGLLMNFGQPTFKEGLRRVANEYFPKQ